MEFFRRWMFVTTLCIILVIYRVLCDQTTTEMERKKAAVGGTYGVEFIGSYIPVRVPRLRSMAVSGGDDYDKEVRLTIEVGRSDVQRRRFDLSLRPIAGVFSPTTNVSTVSSADGRKPTFDAARLAWWRRYEGKLDDDPQSVVSGHAVHGLFRGHVNTADETYFLEPAADYFPSGRYGPNGKKKFNAILYKASDVYVCPTNSTSANASSVVDFDGDDDDVRDCRASGLASGVNGSSLRRINSLPVGFFRRLGDKTARVSRRSVSVATADVNTDADRTAKTDSYLCDLRVIGDFRWYRYVTYRNTTYGTELVESLLRRVDQIFRAVDVDGDGRPDNVGFVLRDMDIYLDPVRPEYDDQTDWDPKRFFEEFRLYDFTGVCAGLLFTYRPLSFGGHLDVPTIPKTNIASLDQGICSQYVPPDGPVGLLSDYGDFVANALPVNFLSPENRVASASSIVVETAHQLGHLFGARDDADMKDDPRCRPVADTSRNYIMAYPLVSTYAERNFRWSPCSREAFGSFLQALEKEDTFCLRPCVGPMCLRDRWTLGETSGGAASGSGGRRDALRPRWSRQDTLGGNSSATTPAAGGVGNAAVTTPTVGDGAMTPALGGGVMPPGLGGDVTTLTTGGDVTTLTTGGDEMTPGFGGDETTPGIGGDETTPGIGGDETTPGIGSGGQGFPPGGAESTVTPIIGDEDSTTTRGGAAGGTTTSADDESTLPGPIPGIPGAIPGIPGASLTTTARGEEEEGLFTMPRFTTMRVTPLEETTSGEQTSSEESTVEVMEYVPPGNTTTNKTSTNGQPLGIHNSLCLLHVAFVAVVVIFLLP